MYASTPSSLLRYRLLRTYAVAWLSRACGAKEMRGKESTSAHNTSRRTRPTCAHVHQRGDDCHVRRRGRNGGACFLSVLPSSCTPRHGFVLKAPANETMRNCPSTAVSRSGVVVASYESPALEAQYNEAVYSFQRLSRSPSVICMHASSRSSFEQIQLLASPPGLTSRWIMKKAHARKWQRRSNIASSWSSRAESVPSTSERTSSARKSRRIEPRSLHSERSPT
mmetsp:Transcript_21248/g.68820  ORF Transcript_21248/g.68820 Transcript_21248/m.68820 type:complete len:224 (+) Transcript_21248:533-1204(+)